MSQPQRLIGQTRVFVANTPGNRGNRSPGGKEWSLWNETSCRVFSIHGVVNLQLRAA